MNIQIKKQVVTWRELRLRYERMARVKGLRGINLVAAFTSNLNYLRTLYESSSFDAQFPASDEYVNYIRERNQALEMLSNRSGSGVVKKHITVDGSEMVGLEIDYNSQLVSRILSKLKKEHARPLEVRDAELKRYDEMLDEIVPQEFLSFKMINRSDAPDELAAYQACDFFITKND